ncbi:MAG: hypothetical protein WAL41_07275, partial [Mycobacterium sp.]
LAPRPSQHRRRGRHRRDLRHPHPVPDDTLDAAGAVAAYKDLARLERDFRHIKADDLDLRPIWHRLEDRVRAHVLICMLACYLTWHLRQGWAPLTYTDERPPARANPVTPARRSARAQAKASYKHDQAGRPYRSCRDLLDHLATLTRDTIRVGGQPVDKLATPDPQPAPRVRLDRRAHTPHPHVDTSHPRQTTKSQLGAMKAASGPAASLQYEANAKNG